MFKWAQKTVKAIVYNRETAQREQHTLSPREIVKEPIGKEMEVIMMALTKVVNELCEIKEAEAERIHNLMHVLKAPETEHSHQIELPLEN